MAKYKFYGVDVNGNTKLLHTENNPNLKATTEQFKSALEAVAGMYDHAPGAVDLTSDTTVYKAE